MYIEKNKRPVNNFYTVIPSVLVVSSNRKCFKKDFYSQTWVFSKRYRLVNIWFIYYEMLLNNSEYTTKDILTVQSKDCFGWFEKVIHSVNKVLTI